MTAFKNFIFSLVKNISPKTIGNDLKHLVPNSHSLKIVDSYINHFDQHVNVTEKGTRVITTYINTKMYGDYGHSFMSGWFIVNENKEDVYQTDPEYNKLLKKCESMWKVMDLLQKKFNEYIVERGRGDRLFVNDKMIKGILIYPEMRILSVEEEIKSISELIEIDIKSERIVKNRYGV